jgi:ABC-type lipoprotein release transport system permease subunit
VSRARRALAAAGIAAASLVVGTAATVGYGLTTGFDRAAAQADLPDVIARFDEEARGTVDARVRALPNVAARSYRYEIKDIGLGANGEGTRRGVLHVVLPGRRGYAITAGRDVRAGREVVVERGLAREWELAPGDRLAIDRAGGFRVVGVAVEPDNVAFPLTVTPRVYVAARGDEPPVNLALLWLADRDRADITLTQARATSFGIGGLAFVTREGIEVLLGQAAGIVLSLLVAFALVALVAAGTMLAASAQAEVQRRLAAVGVQRAIGFTPGRLAARQAAESARLAAPAAAAGLAVGALAVAGPTADLLAQLNEQPPGAALLPILAICLLAITALVTAAATWPAWRAARRPPAEILRGGDLARARRRFRRPAARPAPPATTAPRAAAAPFLDARWRDGLLATGARFAVAARGRWAASVATIAVCAGVVTLMLALAALLERLRDDPGTVGKRYQLTVRLDPFDVDAVRAIPGVGLADALGLRPGAMLAVQTAGGDEARFRVVGVVRALEHDGRVAYVRPPRLLAAQPDVGSTISVRLDPGADRAAVEQELEALGAPPQPVGGATTRNAAFLGVLATVLRGVGLAVGLVCLYALVQALAMTARERRGAVALLRACGGDTRTIAAVFAGAALAVALPAAIAGVLLEWLLLGPLVARRAAGFADLPLAPSAGQVALVLGGLVLLAAAATALVARRTMREPVLAGLREE